MIELWALDARIFVLKNQTHKVGTFRLVYAAESCFVRNGHSWLLPPNEQFSFYPGAGLSVSICNRHFRKMTGDWLGPGWVCRSLACLQSVLNIGPRTVGLLLSVCPAREKKFKLAQ